MKQLSNLYPADLPSFTEINNNISLAVDSVQNGQYAVDTIYLRHQNFNPFSTKQYTIGANRVVTFQTLNINSHIFDYVTVSASMKSLSQASLNFSPQVFQVTTVDAATTIFFKVRYNSLFQILPTEKAFINTFESYFNDLLMFKNSQAKIFIIVSVLLILLIFLVAIILAISVVKKTDMTMLLFGHLTRYEV